MSNCENKPCILCQRECDTYHFPKISITEYHCSICSSYAVHEYVDTKNFKLLASMRYFLLHKRPNKKSIYFVPDESTNEDNEYVTHIGVKTLENIYPRDFFQRIDMILINLACLYDGIGREIDFMNTKSAPNSILRIALFVDKENLEERSNEISGIFSLLSEMGFIVPLNDTKSAMPKYRITARGWLRIQELEINNKIIPQGFIAMWFDPQMDSIKSSIISAIQDSGYMPMIISNKEHNNQIVPEILFEINRSTFMIADLTGHRNGVYYEAGYAHALGKEVILSCRKKDFEERHFDVSQKNTIKWENEHDLYEKLIKRIEATVGKNI